MKNAVFFGQQSPVKWGGVPPNLVGFVVNQKCLGGGGVPPSGRKPSLVFSQDSLSTCQFHNKPEGPGPEELQSRLRISWNWSLCVFQTVMQWLCSLSGMSHNSLGLSRTFPTGNGKGTAFSFVYAENKKANPHISVLRIIQGVFFTGTPPKNSKYKKLIYARLGVSWPFYVNVDSPNLGFTCFNFLGGYQ